MAAIGLDVPTLAAHTRSSPYAGAALEALQRRWPHDGPTPPRRARDRAALATLVVDAYTLEVEVGGRVVLMREMDNQIKEIIAKRTEVLPIEVAVPAGEAVYVRTMRIGYAANGGYWLANPNEGWSALVAGGRYPIVLGHLSRLAPPGTTCIAVEGVPEGRTAELPPNERAGEQLVFVRDTTPPKARIRPTEAGRYVVVFRPEGMERVHFEAGGCGEVQVR